MTQPCGCLWAAGTTICRLHLSAPDLLAALEDLTAECGTVLDDHWRVDSPAMIAAAVAIAKATGTETTDA